VTWGFVILQHPGVCNACLHTCHPFPQSFKDLAIKTLIESLFWWHKFLADEPLIGSPGLGIYPSATGVADCVELACIPLEGKFYL